MQSRSRARIHRKRARPNPRFCQANGAGKRGGQRTARPSARARRPVASGRNGWPQVDRRFLLRALGAIRQSAIPPRAAGAGGTREEKEIQIRSPPVHGVRSQLPLLGESARQCCGHSVVRPGSRMCAHDCAEAALVFCMNDKQRESGRTLFLQICTGLLLCVCGLRGARRLWRTRRDAYRILGRDFSFFASQPC
jgi:hypothetical protein